MFELLTSLEMAEADRRTIAGGLAGIELMENAGRAVADAIAARHPPGQHVAIVAGPGNNGGDGFVAARILAERGYRVRTLFVGDPNRLTGDAAVAAQGWRGPSAAAAPAGLMSAEVVVDALFGAGLDRPVEGLARAMIEATNTASCVYAVDLPSGINGTTGAVMGVAVNATETVTFFRRKIGHALLPGRLHCGKVLVADIGIAAKVLDHVAPSVWINTPELWLKRFSPPRIDGHKYARGHAVVVSGGLASTGAARLAARAAPREALAVNAAASLAVIMRPVDGADELAEFLNDRRRNVVVLGPGGGMGRPMRELVLAALAGERAVVLDADALTSFAGEPQALTAVTRARTGATIMTPHVGEFSRLFRGFCIDAPSKLEKARSAAKQTGAVILLKGPDTVVAAPDGRAVIAENAPPWLATAGSGDVLAGMVAACLAQGMPAFEAAAAAVWLHGEAGVAAGPGLIAEDLSEAVPAIYRRLFDQLGVRRG